MRCDGYPAMRRLPAIPRQDFGKLRRKLDAPLRHLPIDALPFRLPALFETFGVAPAVRPFLDEFFGSVEHKASVHPGLTGIERLLRAGYSTSRVKILASSGEISTPCASISRLMRSRSSCRPLRRARFSTNSLAE